MKSKLFLKNSKIRSSIISLVGALIVCAAHAGQAFATPKMGTLPEIGAEGGVTTFWSLMKLGGGVSIGISVVLALGIFLIVFKIYELIGDYNNSKALINTNYRQMSVSEVNKLVTVQPNSLIARLYSVLLSIFHTTGNTNDFHDEIANYIQLQQGRFNTFRSRLAFLSDTAGALGLLGTVWGMFVTFFGGNLDSQRILNGMGLALVTTLIGLVVSIILNFFATEVFSSFNKRIEMISGKSDEFRLWLMAIVKQRQKKAVEENSGGNSSGSSRRAGSSAHGNARPQPQTVSLIAVSSVSLTGNIGQQLSEPISALVETGNGEKVVGASVQFQIVSGQGQLPNQSNHAIIQTDANGVAKINWTLGLETGPQKMSVSMPNMGSERLEFVALAHPIAHLADSLANLNRSSAAGGEYFA